jgi:serine/threonine-protein kinase
VKLLDFGISKIRTPSPEQKNLTTDGSLLGTPYYMSPEQAQGKSDIDHRADIYAYGVILYELLTGQVPFEDENMLRVIAMHALEEPRPPRALNPNIPPDLEALILKAMAKQPAARFQTMNDVLATLRHLASGGANSFAMANVNNSGALPVGAFDMTGMATPAPIPGSSPSWGATTPAPINTGQMVGSNVQAWTGVTTGGSMPGAQTVTPMAWSEGGPPKSGGGLKIAAILGGVGLVVVLGVVGIVVAMSGGDDEVTAPPPITTTTQPTYPTTPTVPTYPTPTVPTYPTPTVPTYPTYPTVPTNPIPTQALPMPTKVAIRIESTPDAAEVYEGSQRLGTTPYLLTADMGGVPRSFLIKRSGYRDKALTITPDQNRVVTAELERERRSSGSSTKNQNTGYNTGHTTKTTGHGLTKANPFD